LTRDRNAAADLGEVGSTGTTGAAAAQATPHCTGAPLATSVYCYGLVLSV